MTFLELCQRLVSECGITGSITSVSGQTGEMQSVVQWINAAWLDIQRKNTNWGWMRSDFQVSVTSGDYDYLPTQVTDVNDSALISAAGFAKWHLDSFRIYRTADGISTEKELVWMPHRDWRATYDFGARQSGPPDSFTIRLRDRAILLGPFPNDTFTLYGEYQRQPSEMAANDDVPGMPSSHHDAIWQRARMKYATRENAPEVMAEASAEYNRLMGELSALEIEEIDLGAPLA